MGAILAEPSGLINKGCRELEGKVYIAWNPYPHKVSNQGAERDAR